MWKGVTSCSKKKAANQSVVVVPVASAGNGTEDSLQGAADTNLSPPN